MLSLNRVVLLGLAAVAAFLVWQVTVPAKKVADDAGEAAVTILDTRTSARFGVAKLNLDTQHRTTGSYAGAAMPEGAQLVRADESAFCVQVGPPGTVSHLAGPGGSPAAGAC